MGTINRRRFVAGALAGGAASAGACGGGLRRASAQSAFDVVAGVPGCGQVALVFNAGSGYEPATGVLDTLGTYGVPASFFVMGWLAEQSPWLVQSIASWGHVVGSHGCLPPELTSRSDEDVAWDLGAAAAALPWIIEDLRAKGYRFVSVPTIAGVLGRRLHATGI